MASPGAFTAEDATKMGYMPVGPIKRIIDQWVEENRDMDFEATVRVLGDEQGGAAARLADFTGLSHDLIIRIRNGRKDWIEFDNADRIITFINPLLWHGDEELAELYQGFDFTYLDMRRPPSPEADELTLLEGISTRSAAVAMGVSRGAVQGQRRKRAAA